MDCSTMGVAPIPIHILFHVLTRWKWNKKKFNLKFSFVLYMNNWIVCTRCGTESEKIMKLSFFGFNVYLIEILMLSGNHSCWRDERKLEWNYLSHGRLMGIRDVLLLLQCTVRLWMPAANRAVQSIFIRAMEIERCKVIPCQGLRQLKNHISL